MNIQIEGVSIQNQKEQKLLGVVFDNRLTFDTHINTLCKKAGSKISALSRLTPYMNFEKKRLLMNAFFNSQFSYCPLVWMFHSRKLNNKINFLQERCLRLIYNDKSSTFENLLKRNNSVCFHHRNLQFLAIELYKVKHELSPVFLNEIFLRNEKDFNGRKTSFFKSRSIRSVLSGSESLSFVGPKIWDMVPFNLQNAKSLTSFKSKIKKWVPDKCPCRICKKYIEGVGFIN